MILGIMSLTDPLECFRYLTVESGCRSKCRCVWLLLIPMKVGTDSGLIPGSDSDVIPGVFGAKRRWPSYRA